MSYIFFNDVILIYLFAVDIVGTIIIINIVTMKSNKNPNKYILSPTKTRMVFNFLIKRDITTQQNFQNIYSEFDVREKKTNRMYFASQ